MAGVTFTRDFLGRPVRRGWVGGVEVVETLYGPHERSEPHAHPDPYFCWVVEGSVVDRSLQGAGPLRAGEGFFRPAGRRHEVSYPRPGARCLMVRLGPAWWADTGRVGEQVLASWASGVGALLAAPPTGCELEAEERVTALVRSLAVAQEAVEPLHPAEGSRRLLERWSLDGAVSITALAAELGMHPSHLARSFRRRWGRTMSQYVRELRVERARRLLARGVTPADAAAAAGFFDQSHLNRAFRQLLKTTPGRYRARCRGARTVQDQGLGGP